jgi:hypothetical protein
MTTITPIKSLPIAWLVFVAAMFASCSDDPAPKRVVHYFHPLISPDTTLLFAGFESYTEGQSAPATSPNFIVRTMATERDTAIYLPAFSPRNRYWVEPRVSSIVFASGADTAPGFRFYARTAAPLGFYSIQSYGVKAEALAFKTDGGVFLWAGSSSGRVKVVHARYSTQSWVPDMETVLLDTLFDASVHDVCFTSDVTFALYLSNGNVREYNMQAALLHSWLLTPRSFDDTWQPRLLFKEGLGARRLFTLDDSGIVMLDLQSQRKTLITWGYVKQLDVNPGETSSLMAYETRSGDVWLAYIDADPVGLPRNRLRQQHAPFFSLNGFRLATVSRIDAWTDTLATRTFPFTR